MAEFKYTRGGQGSRPTRGRLALCISFPEELESRVFNLYNLLFFLTWVTSSKVLKTALTSQI